MCVNLYMQSPSKLSCKSHVPVSIGINTQGFHIVDQENKVFSVLVWCDWCGVIGVVCRYVGFLGVLVWCVGMVCRYVGFLGVLVWCDWCGV